MSVTHSVPRNMIFIDSAKYCGVDYSKSHNWVTPLSRIISDYKAGISLPTKIHQLAIF